MDVAVSNIADKIPLKTELAVGWPVLAALVLWLMGWGAWAQLAGWFLVVWAALTLPNGATSALWALFVFLAWNIGLPALKALWRWPRGAEPSPAAATALIVGGLMCFGWKASAEGVAQAMPESVTQSIRVEDNYALATAKIRWQATKGQRLLLVAKPAVLTHINYSARTLKLEEAPEDSAYSQQLAAQAGGVFDIEVQYQTPVNSQKGANSFTLPVPFGLINQLDLTLVNLDADIVSRQAVSMHSDHTGTNTVAWLVLSPGPATISWQPRRRDVQHEKPLFYAELTQLYVPVAGVIEGAHAVAIRPAQGELSEVTLDVPPNSTITDVTAPGSLVSLWRFDADARKLRVSLNPEQSRPFVVLVRSQIAAGPLPFTQSVGLLTVEGATSQIGLACVATGNEVQLDSVTPRGLSPINLEDFPGDTLALLQGQVPNLTVRRAFRYSDTNATLALRAAAVEPDVRVESDDTLSLGEDRTVLADNLNVSITRAGVFDLSFIMPPGFDVESIGSPVLSQWTELKTDAGRVITLHLNGKTQGQQSFVLTLVGPGVKAVKNWRAPQVILREANKQSGSLLVVPEQGMRLLVNSREGYIQFDPQKSGVRQKGVLGFRLLQVPARLALDVEQVDPWIQVTSLQHAVISEAQVKVTANLQYLIENTGLKTLRVSIPTNAENVRFDGEQVADFAQARGVWEIKLRRRVLGQYLLQATYQIPLPEGASETVLRGIRAEEVNLQRGFVTVQSEPRLEVVVPNTPEALQPTEWQSIPRSLQKDLQTVAAIPVAFKIGATRRLQIIARACQ